MAGIFFAHIRLGGIVLVLLTFLSSSTPYAQVATGSIVGTVSDSTGQVVPGAQVTIREVNRNTTTTLVTDGSGVYTAPFLVPGTYEVQVELQGFKTWIRRGIILQVTDRVRVDVALEVGTIKEATTVVASAPVVRTDSSEVGTVIEETAIKELPLNGRNFATLVYLAPGITPGQAGENLSGASTFNPRGASNFNALGSQANSNALADRRHRQQRVHVQHLHRHALGRAGARIQGPHRRVLGGVRAWRRRRLGVRRSRARISCAAPASSSCATTPSTPAISSSARPCSRTARCQGSGAAARSAPVRGRARRRARDPGLYDGHNRTFFFADYAGIKERARRDDRQYRADAAARLGDFSNYRDRNGNVIPIYDPLTTRLDAQPGASCAIQFPNNIIPAGPPQSGRPQHRQRLSAPEHRIRQLRQLHLDARSRGHRSRVFGPRRSQAVGQRLVLRAVQLRQVQPRCAAGPGELLPADAAGGGGPVRSRARSSPAFRTRD